VEPVGLLWRCWPAILARRSAPSGPSPLRVTVVRTSSDVTASALADFIQATAQTEPPGVAEDPPLNVYLGLRLAVLPPAVLAHLQPGDMQAAPSSSRWHRAARPNPPLSNPTMLSSRSMGSRKQGQ
jgi:hypothetical protein